MGQPDFRRVPFAEELRCFDGAQRHRAAEHHDRLGFHERTLHYHPAAKAKENHCGEDQASGAADGKNAQSAGTGTQNHSGIVRSCHWGTGACYPAPLRWSIGGAGHRFMKGLGELRERQNSSLEGQSHSARSEEHTSELQSPCNLVCRLLLEKKKKKK